MTRAPKVSVVTIFLNAEAHLEEAIASVFTQTFDDWELLLVNDGSTDRSVEIARNWVSRYPVRVRFLQHDGAINRGMSASRNLGIQNARGDYIALLDADDVWLPDKLAEQVPLLERYPDVAMVYSGAQFWYSWSGNADDLQRDFIEPLGVAANQVMQPPRLLELSLSDKAPTPSPSNVLIRKDAILAVHGFEEQFTGLYEDQVFLSKLYLQSPIYVADNVWSKYRQHANSCVALSLQNGTNYRIRLKFLRWLRDYVAQQGSTRNVRRVVSRALFRTRFARFYLAAHFTARLFHRIRRGLKTRTLKYGNAILDKIASAVMR
jgi:glycosyltransferase involved in cell wall biosynthesis